MLKESKIRVLENFYALDYVFFGKSVNKVDTCCPLVREEYLSIKGALLSVFVEMLKLVEHKPAALTEQVDSKSLLQNAKKSATIARENAEKIVSTAKARANIKESLKEALKNDPDADIPKLVEDQIRIKAFSLATDGLMLARVARESKFDKLNEWEGRIIEDSYKILRDNLIEAAYQMLYDPSVDTEKEVSNESVQSGIVLGAILGFITPIPYGTAAGAAAGGLAGWALENRKKVHKYCSNKFEEGSPDWRKCVTIGKQAMKQKLEKAKAKAAKAKK